MADEYLKIPLRRRDGSIRAFASIDKEDADLAQYRWCLDSRGYVVRNLPMKNGVRPRPGQQTLHRAVLGLVPGDGLEGDHWNGNRLDNRRENLHIVTGALNRENVPSHRDGSSRYRGVDWFPRRGKWRVRVRLHGVVHNLGYYDDEDEAGRVASEGRQRIMSHANEERSVACR